MLEKFEDNHFKWFFLVLLILTVGLITYLRVRIQMDLGPEFDVYDLLANAALFAGKGIGFSDLLRPPFLSFLTSIYFVFDGLNIGAIFAVDGILYFVGCIGLYLFLKERFTPLISFVGSLLFATFPIVITYVGVGYNDVSSVAVGIWAIYLTYLGVKRNSKFFYIAFPVAMLAFLTRYNMALLIFPMFFYILINRREIRNPKDVIVGILLGFLVLVPVLLFFSAKLGNPIYPFLDFFGTSEGSGTTEHFAYNLDPLYFVKYLPYYLGTASLLIIFSTVLALLFLLYQKIRKAEIYTWNNILKKGTKIRGTKTKLLLILVLSVFLIVTFGKLHYMLSEVVFFALLFLIYDVSSQFGSDSKMDLLYCKMDILFLSWFAAFFIFQSVYVTKDHRYFIAMAAPVAYFLARGLSFSTETFQLKFKKKNLTLYIFSLILVLLMISSTFSQLSAIETVNTNNKVFTENVSDACSWLMNYDHDYKSKVIYADLWSCFAWYLQTDVGKMPIFRNNQTLYQGVKDYNFTAEDKMAFDNELNKTNPDYYFCIYKDMSFTNYEAIQRFGSVTIYKRVR
ncbi:MAG: hypothetical protein B655_1652 [Methanobacterium sp. Maddingley MBC34]|nr:MAG: hypothetical protein B655_1652 [Methanobacterium sp. Maddingley MBC34]